MHNCKTITTHVYKGKTLNLEMCPKTKGKKKVRDGC